MGLDMYAFSFEPKPDQRAVDFKLRESEMKEIHYWRKHPNLHGWMRQLYETKGGTNEDFNCTPVLLTREDLDDLERDIKAQALPDTDGFFFGETRGDEIAGDLQFIAKARKLMENGQAIAYYAWW